MTKLLRMTCLAASVAAVTLAASPAAAAPVGAATPGTARVRVVQPLVLTAEQNLDFGYVILGAVAAGGETVTLSSGGVITSCGVGGLTCTGTPVAGRYNVQGSNNMVVRIYTAASPLTNPLDSSTLTFTPSAQNTITLTNSGAPGDDFNVGGSVVIMPGATEGEYVGDMDVTVDYF